jgi:two-component system, LytTR family, response regulator
MTIRVCIADDEPLARERIRTFLEQEPDVRVVSECADGAEAIAEIQRERPDLVFLDIQMPGLNGFEVARRLMEREEAPPALVFVTAYDQHALPPAVIFVTAHDEYALQAFEVHALDYLLKPFNGERFRRALQRARLELLKEQPAGVSQRLLSLLEELQQQGRRPQERLVLKTSGRVSFLKVDEIDWIEAEGNYVRLHVGVTSHLLRETMKGIEARLDPSRFIRIHRSTIVNTDRIRELQPLFHGEYAVILQDGTRLTASRGPDNKLRRFIEAQ